MESNHYLQITNLLYQSLYECSSIVYMEFFISIVTSQKAIAPQHFAQLSNTYGKLLPSIYLSRVILFKQTRRSRRRISKSRPLNWQSSALPLSYYDIYLYIKRIEWDSNPRYHCWHASLAGKSLKPLAHLSKKFFNFLNGFFRIIITIAPIKT